MASKFINLFKPNKSSSESGDGGKEDEATPKKEVRVQEPASEDGEQHKAKATSVKKTVEKKGPPPVSRSSLYLM